jgi:hypothetical protein
MYAMKTQEHTLALPEMKQEWMRTSLLFLWKILLERPVCTENTHTHTHTHTHTDLYTVFDSFIEYNLL